MPPCVRDKRGQRSFGWVYLCVWCLLLSVHVGVGPVKKKAQVRAAKVLEDDPDDKQAWLRARDYLGVHIIGSSLACIAAKSLGVPRWEDLMEATASHPLLPDVPP